MGHCGVVGSSGVRFRLGKLDDAGAAQVHFEGVVLDVDSRPDDLARLGDAAERAAAVGEIHGGLAVPVGELPAAEMGRRGRAAD